MSEMRPLRGKGGCDRQADGTAGLPPAPEISVRSSTYASCHKRTKIVTHVISELSRFPEDLCSTTHVL